MRPVEIHKVFELSVDILICLYGGMVSTKLCQKELKERLEPYDHLISFESSAGEETHMSKSIYFDIVSSNDKVKDIGNTTCCLISIHAFENLKKTADYKKIANLPSVKLLNHLRNASAHGNVFHFYDRGKFVPPKSVTWKGKTIDENLQDKCAFPDFFSAGDFAYLFEDISKELKSNS